MTLPQENPPEDVTPPPSVGDLRYLARQPILELDKQLHGYELLFRSGETIAYADVAQDHASLSTLDLSLLLGAESFTGGHRAFVNCTRAALCSGVLRRLPRELLVFEVLEDVPADEETVRNCRALKDAGYKLALDDIVSEHDPRTPFFELADYIKADFLLTDAARQQAMARRFARRGVHLVAEKVETPQQFQSAVSMGYTLFQGFFFCRPETLKAGAMPSSSLACLDILRRVNQQEIDLPELARVIRQEPALCYRLLRYLNSAACRQALNGLHNRLGLALALSVAAGRGQWQQVPALCAQLGCTAQDALLWQQDARLSVDAMLDGQKDESLPAAEEPF